jgi:hypothetical protein
MADKSGWTLALVGASGLVIGALISGGFSYLNHQGDMDAKMIELSVGVLRADPTPETSPLREWAIDTIEKRAKFSFSAEQRAALLKRRLPFDGGFDAGFGRGFQGGGILNLTPQVGPPPVTSPAR